MDATPEPISWFAVCSTEVWPQMREYERAVASTINAYVRPKVSAYLNGLAGVLERHGIKAPALITRSNGGIMSAEHAKDRVVPTQLLAKLRAVSEEK